MEHPLLNDISRLLRETSDRDNFLLQIARRINHHFPHFTWVGFYFLKNGKLHVGPYVGAPTPHEVIELNKGICGAAVSQGQTIVVDDVNADPRYLACSLATKSEIVIPLLIDGKIIGELDIDSDRPAAFGEKEKILLEKIAKLIAGRLSRQ